MPALLGLIPARLLVVLAVAAAVLGWGAFQRHQMKAAQAETLTVLAREAKTQADASKAAIDELARQVNVQQGAIRDAQAVAASHRASAGAAAGALQRLQHRYAAALAGGGAASAPAGGSQAAPDGAGVCAGLLDRLGAIAGRYAAIANARGNAGQACERISDGEVKR